MRFSLRPSALLGSFLTAALLASAAPAQTSFSEQTGPAGLSFRHKHSGFHPAAAQDGGGAVGDFNRDGWPDLFVIGGGGVPDALFMNQGDGTFVDESAAWGLDEPHRGTGAAVADYDGDGWPDLYVTSFGPMSGGASAGMHRLYHNEGGSGFTEVAVTAKVNSTGPVQDGFGPTFGDYDLDGDLDLFVASWVWLSEGNRLFRNDGDGTFTDVTVDAGILIRQFRGFSPRFVDMNGDRYPELLVAADNGTSRYFKNNTDGTFTDLTGPSGTGTDRNGMGSTVADFNRDGLFDWYVTAIWYDALIGGVSHGGNRLYLNLGNDTFYDTPEASTVCNGGWGWGATAADFDLDGWVDIFETNGWSSPEWKNENCYLFRNGAYQAPTDGTWTNVASAWGVNLTGQGRGVAHMDHDRDGDMDMVVFHTVDELVLLRNDPVVPGRHWLGVSLDTSANDDLAPDGIGARVEVVAGGVTQWHYVHPGSTYLSTSELTAHFGLNDAVLVDELRVHWPDGSTTEMLNVAVDQYLTVSAPANLVTGGVTPGAASWVGVRGAEEGEVAVFAASFHGSAPAAATLWPMGLAVDLVAPAFSLGSTVVDRLGRAEIPVAVPARSTAPTVTLQAILVRGTEQLARTSPVTVTL